jgi:transposase
MSKYTLEIKLRAVLRYLEGHESFKSIAKELRTCSAVVMNWVNQYKYQGAEAFKKSYTSYSTQYKLDVLNYMIENGTSPNETAAIFNISEPSMIRKWRRGLEKEGVNALNSKKKGRPFMKNENQKATKKPVPDEGSSEALHAEVERLRMENAYLKKLNALVQNKEKSPMMTKPKSSMN